MKQLFSTLLDGLRAVFLCRPRNAAIRVGAGTFIALVVLYFFATLGVSLLDTAAPWAFEPAGITTVLADSLLTLLAAWLLVVLAGRREIIWGVASLLLAATICAFVIVHWPLAHAASALLAREQVLSAMLLMILSRLWWLLVLFAIAHRLSSRGFGYTLVAALLAYAISAAPWWWLPQSAPVQTAVVASDIAPDVDNNAAEPADGDEDSVSPGDTSEDNKPLAFDAEEVMFNQRALLDAALAKLQPSQPGHPHLYVVGFAGDAAEDVFRNETEYAERLFAQRFDATGRVLVLQNNAATVATRPLATWTNLHYALEAIAKKMDPAEDILLLYLTTHGSEDHQLLVDLDPLPLDQIEPQDLADALRTTPAIRWKVVVVNACYSGGFIDAVRDDSTMVIASARADRTSFGCGADSDITYFGKAFLTEALNQTTSLRDAFDLATRAVSEWETADKEEHSEPQIATSRSIEAKLERWQRGLAPAPPVPFAPASATPATAE